MTRTEGVGLPPSPLTPVCRTKARSHVICESRLYATLEALADRGLILRVAARSKKAVLHFRCGCRAKPCSAGAHNNPTRSDHRPEDGLSGSCCDSYVCRQSVWRFRLALLLRSRPAWSAGHQLPNVARFLPAPGKSCRFLPGTERHRRYSRQRPRADWAHTTWPLHRLDAINSTRAGQCSSSMPSGSA